MTEQGADAGTVMASTLQLYTEFFGLRERPFTLLPDPEYLFWSKAHTHAFTMLEYGLLTHAPITVITGEIGAGKTTLIRELLKEMPDDFTVGLISNAQGGRGELLQWVLLALDQPFENNASYVQLFSQFQAFLIEEYAEGRRTVLIFDEAQNLNVETLEELRMFSNINADKDELLQLVLVGQPQLQGLINQPNLEQFRQRITAEYHLPRMDRETVADYIRHRLRIAGATYDLFTPTACESIYIVTRGVPRVVNQICDFCMIYAFSFGKKEIDAQIVEQVVQDRQMFGVSSDSTQTPR